MQFANFVAEEQKDEMHMGSAIFQLETIIVTC